MIPLFTNQDIRDWDRALIKQGFPSHTLMELAGKGAAEYLHRMHPHESFSIFCGSGNNGGDGYVIARWLLNWGHDVFIVVIADPKTTDSICNAQWCSATKKTLKENTVADVVIDAMLGTGQNRPLQGAYRQGAMRISEHKKQGSLVYALDIPTGIEPNCGAHMGDVAVHVDGCFSFGKPRLALYRNADMGNIIHIDIGFDLLKQPPEPQAFLIQKEDMHDWWPKENPSDAKWNRGHVAIVARGGAGVLAAHAALIMGAGLVSIVCSHEDWNSLKGVKPEIMHATSLSEKRHDCVVFGPGITEYDDLQSLWIDFPKPIILDAGGISLLAKAPIQQSSHKRILTPHSAEAARLLGISRTEVEQNPFLAVHSLQKFGFSILKGPYTKIGWNPMWIAPRGSIRLATAGSGDVLAGMVGAFVSKGLSTHICAALACSVHALAGTSMTKTDSASDLLQKIKILLE